MFFWLKVGALAAFIGVLALAWFEHDHEEQAKGAAAVEKRQAESDARTAQRDAALEHIGRQTADEQAARTAKRLRDAQAKLATDVHARQALADALASANAVYRDWRAGAVPAAVVVGVREHAAAVAGTRSGVLPDGVLPDAHDPAGHVDE